MTKGKEDDKAEWVSEAIVEFLKGPMYVHPLMGFIDEQCLIFTPEDENKFEYTIIHGKFQELVDALLTDFLEELGVSVEEFFKIATDSKDKLTGFVVQTILTVDDFMMFKAMMVKRNMDLTNQVLNAMEELQAVVEGAHHANAGDHPVFPGVTGAKDPQPMARTSTSGAKKPADAGKGGKLGVDPADMEKALELSKKEFEAQARMQALHDVMRSLQLQDEDVAIAIAIANSLRDEARSQAELAELEQAIALSLLLEAEQRRMHAGGSSADSGAGSSKGKTQQDLLSEAFPEPKPMAPLPQLHGLSEPAGPVNVLPLEPLNIGPNTAADKMAAVAAAAARAASLLSAAGLASLPAVPGASKAGSSAAKEDAGSSSKSRFVPEPLKLDDGKKLPPVPPTSSGRFVPEPLNLPDKAVKQAVEVPQAEEFVERSSAGASKQAAVRNRAAGFKSGGAGAMDMVAIREAASAAAATQKDLIAAQRAGKDGDDTAHAWLQDAKKQLVAKKKAEREAEMAEYQNQKKTPKKSGKGTAGGAASDDLEAKRAELREQLAQKFKQDLLSA